MIGNRKFILGLCYVAVNGAMVETAILMCADAGVIAAASSVSITMAGGIAAIVYGNVKEHQAKQLPADPKRPVGD